MLSLASASSLEAQGSLFGGSSASKCPAKAQAGSLGTARTSSGMSEAQAATFLAQVKHDALAKESAAGAAALTTSLAKAAQSGGSSALALGLFMNNYQNGAIAAFADVAAQTAHAVGKVRGTAWVNLGAALDAAGRYGDAIRAFDESIALGGRTYAAVTGLGVATANAGDLTNAESLLREASGIDKSRGDAFASLGNVLSCEGKTSMAFAAVRSAQAVQFVDDVQNTLDHDARQHGNDNGDDPSGPLPEAPGSSLSGNGYGRSQAGPQIATPNIDKDVPTYLKQAPQLMAQALAYQNEAAAHLAKTNDYDGRDNSSSGAPTKGLIFITRYQNDATAKAATTVILTRTQPKLDLAMTEFGDALQQLQRVAGERTIQNNQADIKCRDAAKTPSQLKKCDDQKCAATKATGTELHAQWTGAYNLLASGFAGAAARYDKAMRGWIDYATSPGVQYALDQERRAQLASFAGTLFSQANDGYAATCDDPTGGQGGPTSSDDDDQKPGPCKSFHLDLKNIASLEGDCSQFTFSPNVPVPLDLDLTIKMKRATGNAPGSLYISVGKDVDVPMVAKWSGDAGFAMSWNADGLVSKSGLVAQTTVTVDKSFAQTMQELTGRTQSTTSLSLEAGYNIVNHTAFAGAYGS